MRRTSFASASALLAILCSVSAASAGHPDGAAIFRVLGPRAPLVFTRGARPPPTSFDGLVRLPPGATAASLGLEPVVPGYARLRGPVAKFLSFSSAHPEAPVELSPPLHTLLDQAGRWTNATTAHKDPTALGTGALVGVADTGLDVTHPDFLDAAGHSRVAWILDLSLPPAGFHPDLEDKYGIKNDAGVLTQGAVFTGAEIDKLAAAKKTKLPTDEVGHGTHVTSIAAGNGGLTKKTPYVGMAPEAGIVFARITRDASDNIDNSDLVRGTQFLFDRADFEKKPIAVNLSLGSDFGPHDGTTDWEQVIGSYIGPDQPGHTLVAAAGNSGSILDSPIHQSVRATPGTRMRIPVTTQGSVNGAIEVWVAMRPGTSLSVGLDGPDGEWIAPVGEADERGKNTSAYNAGVINGSSVDQSPIPQGSHGAVVLWSGTWPAGTYYVTLEGEGTAEMYIEGTGDVGVGSNAGFVGPVREGTVNLPATHPGVIGVGCTINRVTWTSIDRSKESQGEPVLDAVGGTIVEDPANPGHALTKQIEDGEMCWFSSAGPTLTGVPKPEIAAPGGIVVAAMSQQAKPGSGGSIFTTYCPAKDGQPGGSRCLQVDELHGVSQGTSMSAPMVAGAIAVLLERDPTLTQDKVVALLQAGAHQFRGAAPYGDQSGPGELDLAGSLDALSQTWTPRELLPDLASSWITVSGVYAPADGATPLTAIIELRTANGEHRADLFDPTRLQPVLQVNGATMAPPTLTRRGPGVWFFTVEPPPGSGGSSVTVGATFDGKPIVAPKTLPIAADVWRAEYASSVKGSCALAPRAPGSSTDPSDRTFIWGGLALVVVACARARARSKRNRRKPAPRAVSLT